jgi:hypothetical protein
MFVDVVPFRCAIARPNPRVLTAAEASRKVLYARRLWIPGHDVTRKDIVGNAGRIL